MFLTTKRNGPSGLQVHRVGVIAIKHIDATSVAIAGTIVSRSEPFIAKKGVAKALGRLNANPEYSNSHVLHRIDVDELPFIDMEALCKELGLKSEHNYFNQIDWIEANRKFQETFVERSHVSNATGHSKIV